MDTLQIYGTLGPSCHTKEQIKTLFQLGMTGMRLNVSHTNLTDHPDWIRNFLEAKKECQNHAELLIDMKGPELRIGTIQPLFLQDDRSIALSELAFPLLVSNAIQPGQEILLDDGHIQLEAINSRYARIKRGGSLTSHKSITLVGKQITAPTLTASDIENLKLAKQYGVTGVMQPFVRSAQDLIDIQAVFSSLRIEGIRVLAKIENQSGLDALETLFPYCDEIIIARGDLGNAVGLIELPSVQHHIETVCKKYHKPYMVVTQMLHSMIDTAVPTRAEVSDVYTAVYNGASSIMLTGETAIGQYPIEAMHMFTEVAKRAMADRQR